ncbi:unnamed protein product [Miscanthus lutarioriparius]|uniref:histidine kinase n=1 Tax=Miscanthus lutarioriparius TaxID=422564 RepID=A0A811NJD5_9POAL|nr:unnamed protein product [Miscanthus lutarioriparius]
MGARCSGGCDGREDGAVEALVQWQKVSDFLIGASYMSIPLELLHFATCADLKPLRWVLLQFGAFIVLCGLVHLVAVFTYARPDSRRLLVANTAAKVLAAVAAVSLPTFIPQLLRLKTREALLRDKARQLDRDVDLVRRREEIAARVVRAITQHIRRDGGGGAGGALQPDTHAVLRTAVFHLSDALSLSSCAVWMPAASSDDGQSLLHLVHQLPEDEHQAPTITTRKAIRITDPDVAAVMASKDAKVLRPGSALGTTSGHGRAAAIRMPMLTVSNFVDASSSGSDGQGAANHRARGGGGGAREWNRQELEIVEVATDPLAVALSHAAVQEEWQLTRHKLAEWQRVLAQARHDAAVATGARDAAQSAMRDGVLRPMHSVAGLLSLMQAQQQQDGAFRCAEQRVAVDAMARISALSSTLIDDVMAALLTPATVRGEPESAGASVSLARRPFDPRAMVKDAAGVAGCLARCRGLGFLHRAEMSSLPAKCCVVGDDRRVFHLLLHMLGVLLDQCECHCHDLCFAVDTVPVDDQETMSGSGLPDWITPNFSGCKLGMCQVPIWDHKTLPRQLTAFVQPTASRKNQKKDQHQRQRQFSFSQLRDAAKHRYVQQDRADDERDDTSREVTRKLLERLGCHVLPVPSAAHCLSLLLGSATAGGDNPSFQFPYLQPQAVLLDLHTPAAASVDAASAMDDGFEVALRIREVTGDRFSWLLILVALPLPPRASCIDVRDVCKRTGVNGVIHKPITLPALAAQLQRAVHNDS